MPATLIRGRGGRQYQVSFVDLEAWKRKLEDPSEAFESPRAEVPTDLKDAVQRTDDSAVVQVVAVEAHLEALRLLQGAHTEIRRLERQNGGLLFELSQHRRALAESAENLFEKDAQRLTAESLAASLQVEAQEIAQLKEQLSNAEAQRQNLDLQLEQARQKETAITKRLQRVPRWLRRIFLGVA